MSFSAVIAKPEYDNVIKQNPSGSTYPWSASTGVLDANFADTIGTTDSIQIFTQGYQFAWKPDTLNVIDDADTMTLLENVNPNATAQVWNNKLTYVGTTASTSDEFVVDGNQLKHSVRMVAPPRLPSGFAGTPKSLAIGGDIGTTAQDWADIDLWADGTTHTTDFTTSDDLSFRLKSDGKEIYRIPKIAITDDAGTEMAGQYKLVFGANNVVTLYMLCPWDWLQQAQYPIIIDPTVVVSSAYDTSGNGGRKVARLSNNWIVISCFDSASLYIRFFVSKDNGQTWAQLTYMSLSGSGTNFNSHAIASSGTVVYCLFTTNNGGVLSNLFDATTVTNTDIYNSSTQKTVATQSSAYAATLAVDNSGSLQAAWHGVVSTYPNSYNIQYSKGTVSGTTVTWASPTQITTDNVSGNSDKNPCIIVNSSNNPIILFDSVVSSNYRIYAATYNGTSWTIIQVYLGNSYSQSNSCAAIDSNGVIHVVWQGIDSAKSTSYPNILYSKSTDGGSTWSAIFDVTSTQVNQSISSPSITINESNNDLYVFYYSKTNSTDSYTNIQLVKCTGGMWGGSSAITSNTTANAQNPQTLWSEFNMNSSDAVRVIYQDGQASSVEYYSITLNSPPNAPTLTPHGNFDASVAQTLAWTFSDPDAGNTQSAYQLQIVEVTSGSTVVDTGKVASTTSVYALAASTLTNGKNYQWRVQTWDNNGAQGPYSAYSTFSTAAAPTVTVTTPASGGTVNSSQLTVQFSYSDPANNPQQSYEVELLQSDDATVIEDSGTINGTNNAYTLQTVLANNTTYHARVRATNSKGVTSAWADVSFSTSFTLPQQPSVTASSLSTQAKITIAMTNYASKNLVLNSGFEVVTTTATVFSDALTSYTGSTVPAPWTLQNGSFTFGASGATCGANGSLMTAGNAVWSPILGSDGTTKLALAGQATITEPSTVPTYEQGRLYLFKDMNNYYEAKLYQKSFCLCKSVGGTYTTITSVAQTPAASTAYTATLSLDNTGALVAKLYQGTNTSGTLLQTLTATDTSLSGGFLIGVGGDTGVVISNASCVGPWANSWTIDSGASLDPRVAWAVSQSSISGKFSISAVGLEGVVGRIKTSYLSASANSPYTVSAYVQTNNIGNTGSGAWVEVDWYNSSNTYLNYFKTASVYGTSSTQRVVQTGTSVTNTSETVVYLSVNDSGTVTFDNIQLEQGSTATPYIENDSTSSPQQAPAIAYNDVYRRNTGTLAWTRIATQVTASGTYDDYAVASGQAYDYKVTAYGNNGTQVDSTTITNQSVSFTGLWLHDVTNPSGTVLNLSHNTAQNDDWKPTATTMQFAGRKKPVVEFGEQDSYAFNVDLYLANNAANWPALNTLIRSKPTLCVRDSMGAKVFGVILDLPKTDTTWGDKTVSFSVTEIDYSEAV